MIYLPSEGATRLYRSLDGRRARGNSNCRSNSINKNGQNFRTSRLTWNTTGSTDKRTCKIQIATGRLVQVAGNSKSRAGNEQRTVRNVSTDFSSSCARMSSLKTRGRFYAIFHIMLLYQNRGKSIYSSGNGTFQPTVSDLSLSTWFHTRLWSLRWRQYSLTQINQTCDFAHAKAYRCCCCCCCCDSNKGGVQSKWSSIEHVVGCNSIIYKFTLSIGRWGHNLIQQAAQCVRTRRHCAIQTNKKNWWKIEREISWRCKVAA